MAIGLTNWGENGRWREPSRQLSLISNLTLCFCLEIYLMRACQAMIRWGPIPIHFSPCSHQDRKCVISINIPISSSTLVVNFKTHNFTSRSIFYAVLWNRHKLIWNLYNYTWKEKITELKLAVVWFCGSHLLSPLGTNSKSNAVLNKEITFAHILSTSTGRAHAQNKHVSIVYLPTFLKHKNFVSILPKFPKNFRQLQNIVKGVPTTSKRCRRFLKLFWWFLKVAKCCCAKLEISATSC